MKERIYTIPVTEAFGQDCECPLCVLEKKMENDALEYHLGPAMMEPDSRVETNRTGFCARHFTKMYNMQQNRLPLGLVIDTHMQEQNKIIEILYHKHENAIKSEAAKGFPDFSLGSKNSASLRFIDEMLQKLGTLSGTCAVCDRVQMSMDKMLDVTLYLFFKEPDFRKSFEASKGFCLKHLEALLRMLKAQYGKGRQAEFIRVLMPLQIEHMKRVQDDVNYFTKMFDYRSQGLDWKNSRDAIPRSIEKICGPCDLQR